MTIRIAEIVAVLALVVLLFIARHLPLFGAFPIAQITGIICFSYAIFLALQIFQFELKRIRSE